MPNPRIRRISEEVKKVVSQAILFGIKDPRVSKLASVTYVEVTNDLRYATIYISCFDPNHDIQLTIDGLNSAKGFIRKEIGKSMKLHYTPEPIFKIDHSIEHGMHINEIIGQLKASHAMGPDETENSDDTEAISSDDAVLDETDEMPDEHDE
ncbi:MAG: ribosome-binding factor [Clostridiales bacterium]|nr:ribosome-binding factor [Clostridiales bacterium]